MDIGNKLIDTPALALIARLILPVIERNNDLPHL